MEWGWWSLEMYVPNSIRQFVLICHDSLEVHTSITQKRGMEKKKKKNLKETWQKSTEIAWMEKKYWYWGAFLGWWRQWGCSSPVCQVFLPICAFSCIFVTSYLKDLTLFVAGFSWFPFQSIGWCICQMCANCFLSTATLKQHDVKCNHHFMA